MSAIKDDKQTFHVLLCVSGSVASIKIPELLSKLTTFAEVKLVCTERGSHFFTIPDNIECYSDSNEWLQWKKIGDSVLHIELRKWADIAVIAPLSANTLAKIATGICDNLLTSIIRAWDWNNNTLLLVPAMNTLMWSHPLTEPQLQTITNFSKTNKCQIIPPISKVLACGDKGVGAMASVDTIIDKIKQEKDIFFNKNR